MGCVLFVGAGRRETKLTMISRVPARAGNALEKGCVFTATEGLLCHKREIDSISLCKEQGGLPERGPWKWVTGTASELERLCIPGMERGPL